MFKRLGWIVVLAAAASGGCMSASGAVRPTGVTGSVSNATAAPGAPVLAAR
jgi:hypothetical protein